MAANGTPQSELYSTGYGSLPNQYRDRSAEQSSTTSGNPMNYVPNFFDPMYGTQQPGLGRYLPPMVNTNGGALNNQGQGGYAYNLPTSFGPYGGAWGSPYSQQGPQTQQGIQQAGQGSYNNGQPTQQQIQQGYAQNWGGFTGGGWPGQPGGQPSMSGMGVQTQQPGQQGLGTANAAGPVPLPFTQQMAASGGSQMGNLFNRLGGPVSGGINQYGLGQMGGQPQPAAGPTWQGHNVTSDQLAQIQAINARTAQMRLMGGNVNPPGQAPIPTLS